MAAPRRMSTPSSRAQLRGRFICSASVIMQSRTGIGAAGNNRIGIDRRRRVDLEVIFPILLLLEPTMKFIRPLALVSGLGLAAAAWTAADSGLQLGLPAGAAASMREIDAHRIRAHVKFLANDLLEGRGTGARGGDIAANYIATQFALYGLKPAGDDGGYLQKVALSGVHTLPSTSASLQPDRGSAMNLKLAEDIVVGNEWQTDSVDVDAPIVFVGYGIEAPEYN